MKPILCYQKASHKNFLVVDESTQLKCTGCDGILEYGAVIYIVNAYSSVIPFRKYYFCSPQCSKRRMRGEQDEIRIAYLTSVMPENVVLVSDHPTQVADGKDITVFQAAYIPSAKTTDNTKHAGRESIFGATIGSRNYIKHDKESYKELEEDEFIKLLEMKK